LFSIFSASLLIVSTSCNKDEDEPLPPIGGYNSSNDVAKANNVVHFTFDGTNTDRIGNLAPTTAVGATFTTGAKGQGLTLTNGYVLYPAIAALGNANALNSSSIAGWVKISNNGVSPTCLFALTQSASAQTDWNTGPLMMMTENGKPKTVDDTLVLKSIFSTWINDTTRLGGDNINDFGVRETDFKTVKTGGTWVHVVVRYDGATSNVDIYANGIRVSNNNFRKRQRGNPPVDMGVITTKPPVQAVIGAFPNANSGFSKSPAQGWQNYMTGSLDEFRVYTKSLTDDEILALYQLEKAGR
ncbi:MAG: LamG-like jellyroll fold domain-containing protein, partial [Chitinophagaceae bacterium]